MTFISDLDDGIMVKISIEGEKSGSVIDFSRYTCYVYVEVPWYIGVDSTLDSRVCGPGSNPLIFIFYITFDNVLLTVSRLF